MQTINLRQTTGFVVRRIERAAFFYSLAHKSSVLTSALDVKLCALTQQMNGIGADAQHIQRHAAPAKNFSFGIQRFFVQRWRMFNPRKKSDKKGPYDPD
jgi:hypothetical protein